MAKIKSRRITPAVLTETELEKKLINLIGYFLFLFAVYRTTMSIGRYLVDYRDTWLILQNLFLVGAGVSTAIYIYYITQEHPQKKLATKALFKKIFIPETLLLLGILLWALIGVLAINSSDNRIDWWTTNRNEYYDLITQILILYPAGCFLAAKRDWKPLRIALHVILLAATVAAAYIIYTVFQNRIIALPWNDGAIGMNSSLNLSINCYFNTSGLWGYVVLFLCACMLVTSKKWLKLPYLIALPVHFMIITLSQSRTALITICVTMGVMLGLYIICQLQKKALSLWLSWLIGIGIAGAATLILLALRDWLYQFYLDQSHILEALSAASGTASTAGSRDLNITNLSGRQALWKAAFKSMVLDGESFFFGVTPLGVYPRIGELANLGHSDYYTHNQVLEMGVAFGVPSMLMFLVFTGYIIWDCIKAVFLKGTVVFREMLVPLGLFMVLLGNITEATLFDMNYPTGHLFVLLCGWITVRARSTPANPQE